MYIYIMYIHIKYKWIDFKGLLATKDIAKHVCLYHNITNKIKKIKQHTSIYI